MKYIYIRTDNRFEQTNNIKNILGKKWFTKKIKVNDVIIKKIKLLQIDNKLSFSERVLLKVFYINKKIIFCDIIDENYLMEPKNESNS